MRARLAGFWLSRLGLPLLGFALALCAVCLPWAIRTHKKRLSVISLASVYAVLLAAASLVLRFLVALSDAATGFWGHHGVAFRRLTGLIILDVVLCGAMFIWSESRED